MADFQKRAEANRKEPNLGEIVAGGDRQPYRQPRHETAAVMLIMIEDKMESEIFVRVLPRHAIGGN